MFIVRLELIPVLQFKSTNAQNCTRYNCVFLLVWYLNGKVCNCHTYEIFRALATRGSRKTNSVLMLFQRVGSKNSRPIRRNSQSGSCSAFPRIPYAQVATTSVVYRAHSSFASNSDVVSPSKENTNERVKYLI